MTLDKQTVVIIGAGECGARAAFALRENGHTGKVVLIGAEPLHPYERPPLSKAGLADGAEPVYVAPRQRFAEQDIDLKTAVSVTGIDCAARQVALSTDEQVAYDALLIATGATARRLPFGPKPGKRILTLRTFEDALNIRPHLGEGRHLAIIGGGFIGLELAATARKSGARVTLVEGLPRVLSRGVPASIASAIAARHSAEGVDLRCGVSIAELEETGKEATIVLTDGTRIVANLIIVGVGAAPNVALAESAGLAIDNGIAVDDRLRTSAAGVSAAGDCCSFPLALYGSRRVRLEAWRNAQDQGTLAARNILGHDQPISAVPWFWSDQYDLTLQVAGLAEGAATHVTRRLGGNAFIEFHMAQDGRLLAASGISEGNAVARDIRIAEMLIARRARPDPEKLSDPDIRMKSLLN